jgi:predicted Zn-dependent peptidase
MGLSRFANLLLSFVLPVLLCWPPLPSSANPVRETLPNGLEVFILENPGTTSVSVDLWAKVGSRYESSKNNGISHFVEHLLFKGTSKIGRAHV